MKKVLFLSAALLLCISISAENFSDNPSKEKKTNRAVGASLMGKTFQCNGVSMSYLIAEQGTMAFGASVNFEYERKINKTPLGIVKTFHELWLDKPFPKRLYRPGAGLSSLYQPSHYGNSDV